MTVRFLRTTHDEQGHRHHFPAEAEQYWQQHANVIGDVLRLEAAMTLPEIVSECVTYALAYPEGMPYAEADGAYVVQVLVCLCQWGMVRLI